MKILHIIGASIAGGAEKMAINLAIGQNVTNDVQIYFLVQRYDNAGIVLRKNLENNNITYHFGSKSKVRFYSILNLARVINTFKPDIVHCHTPNTELVFLLSYFFRKISPRLVRTLHSTFIKISIIKRVMYFINRFSITVACSDSVAKISIYNKLFKHIHIIRNGIFFDWPIQTKEIKKSFREKLKLDDKLMHFICIGRMDGENLQFSPKAHDTLVDAWIISKAKENSILHILGNGNLFDKLKAKFNDDDNIQLHGVCGNVHEWLLACDVFIMPSRWEGMPIAAIEAAATGLPMILSDISPLMSLGYENTKYFQVNNIAELNRLIDEFKYDTSININKSAESIRNEYSLNKMCESYLNVYKLIFI